MSIRQLAVLVVGAKIKDSRLKPLPRNMGGSHQHGWFPPTWVVPT
ncbi:MAG: hypothetical protein ACI88G_000025, partial [Woeseiaceae bacterium]